MSGHKEDIKLKLAWQTAFELRTCPDSETLHVADPDENLKRHLAICHVCREKREMEHLERNAWKVMREKFATIAMKPGSGTDKQAGQVWTIKKNFGGWREDGRFIRPPSVLLLGKIADTRGWQVAQVCGDKILMGIGDVLLDESFGFAEGWNSYSLKDDRLGNCLGVVKNSQLEQVLAASIATQELAPEGSVLSFFRKMEIDVGTFVAVPSMVELVEEWESAVEEVVELIPGLKLAARGAKDFVLDIAAGTLDLLRGTFKPAILTRSAVATLSDEQKRLIQDNCPVIPVDLKVVDDVLTVTLKWLREKPDEMPVVKVFLSGVEFSNEELIGTGIEKVVIKHPSFTTLMTSQITILKLSHIENVLRIHISGAAVPALAVTPLKEGA